MLWRQRHRFVPDLWGWELPGGLVDADEEPWMRRLGSWKKKPANGRGVSNTSSRSGRCRGLSRRTLSAGDRVIPLITEVNGTTGKASPGALLLGLLGLPGADGDGGPGFL